MLISPSLSKAISTSDLQLRVGDSVSVYSEKAYRRDGGTYFEAVGNVVISSGKDTLYGETASLNSKTGQIIIEGSVRFIGKSLTLYGSKMVYDMNTRQLEMNNARMVTPEFSIVASYLLKKTETQFFAKEAEFTTCRDCAESWKIFGKEIDIEIDQYVHIKHALMKVKGADVLYFPYLILPIKNNRESGLLFPLISTENEEGVSYKQPIFWNINSQRDMTITPTFLAMRGYGLDLQYREIFSELNWVEFNNKMINDKIYIPNRNDEDEKSGTNFFRHFFEFEAHYQRDQNLNQHLRIVGGKDLDFFKDFSYFTKEYDTGNDIGLNYTAEKRYTTFSLGLESQFKRNILAIDPLGFDASYVQILPRINFTIMPHVFWQRPTTFFSKFVMGVDGNVTQFKQNRMDESFGLFRNVLRADTNPYLELNLFNDGPIILKTKYSLEYQEYKFLDDDQVGFSKNSGLISTELSFSIDRIFGLAYEEKYDLKEIADADLRKITTSTNDNAKNSLSKQVIGKLPTVEKSTTKEIITVKKNSYRHSQEFKFIHHQLINHGESGNKTFQNQITTENGWFDFQDSIKADILELASNEARVKIPVNNTIEFQWNNSLIRKTTNHLDYLMDDKYLKDNFNYTKLGHFNISQGFMLVGENENLKNSLTRLFLDTAYSTGSWSIGFNDYYNHQSSDHILSFDGQKRFDQVSLLTQYRYNSYDQSNLKTLKYGVQLRPIDIFGFSFLREQDLEENENISSIYQVDFMPNNNCWILNLNYQENFDEKRFQFNFQFNYGNESFKQFRENFFSFNRLE